MSKVWVHSKLFFEFSCNALLCLIFIYVQISMAYFRKAGHVRNINEKGHISISLEHFKDENLKQQTNLKLFGCKNLKVKSKRTLCAGSPCNKCLKQALISLKNGNTHETCFYSMPFWHNSACIIQMCLRFKRIIPVRLA